MRKKENEPYRAYLLRCWQEEDTVTDQEPLWRFSVEDVFGERRQHGFGSLEALIDFLRVELFRFNRFDPFAVAYVGDTAQEPQRLKSARRPHRIEPTRLFIAVQPGDHGTLWVENRCPDGRNYAAESPTTFWKSIRY